MEQSKPSSLHRPDFRSNNPYWQKLVVPGVNAEYQPRTTAHDFLFASIWEMRSPDIHAAYCVREATILTVRINSFVSIRNQLKEITR